jgi:hypothetical protein
MTIDDLKYAVIGKTQAYKRTFEGPGPARVLADLATFCRANQTTVHTDQRASDILAGRREVWLHINQYLQLSEDEIWALRKEKL